MFTMHTQHACSLYATKQGYFMISTSDCCSVLFEIFIIGFYTVYCLWCSNHCNDCIVTQYMETEMMLYCRGIEVQCYYI